MFQGVLERVWTRPTRNFMPRIKRLDETTVNRIAAGEIIVAPANALKELLENSIDAGSTDILVVVKDGGCKLLHVTDNGCGIDKDDLPLLCERYATSKISNFDDVQTIETFGFRGEALASISHVAHVTVITKRAADTVGWKARYFDGKLVSEITPTACTTGTQILVEDLFFNVPNRLRALKNKSEEYSKIVDIIGRYAVHTENVGFSVGKMGDSHKSLVIPATAHTVERIQQVFGASIASHVIPLVSDVSEHEDIGLLSCDGYIGDANLQSKKFIYPLLFINNRLVQSERMRRTTKQIYTTFLPKGSHYFAYISLKIVPKDVDVNVHPTKREVTLLHEEEICEVLASAIEKSLAKVDQVRSFAVQTVIPSVVTITKPAQKTILHVTDTVSSDDNDACVDEPSVENLTRMEMQTIPELTPSPKTPIRRQSASLGSTFSPSPGSRDSPQSIKRPYEHNLDRTDAKQPRISAIYSSQVAASQVEDVEEEEEEDYIPSDLSSIHDLKQEIEQNADSTLTQVFANFVFVGVVSFSNRLMAVQHGVQLLIVDYGALCKELFYQLALVGFSNFGIILMEDPLSVRQLMTLAGSTEEDIIETIERLREMREMLEQYFSLSFTDNEPDDLLLTSLPLVLKGYIPPLYKLPFFFKTLGSEVDWDEEILCLRGIIEALALLYIPEPGSENYDDSSNDVIATELTDVILPQLKQRLIATTWLKDHVNEIANLPGLYRVFERC